MWGQSPWAAHGPSGQPHTPSSLHLICLCLLSLPAAGALEAIQCFLEMQSMPPHRHRLSIPCVPHPPWRPPEWGHHGARGAEPSPHHPEAPQGWLSPCCWLALLFAACTPLWGTKGCPLRPMGIRELLGFCALQGGAGGSQPGGGPHPLCSGICINYGIASSRPHRACP